MATINRLVTQLSADPSPMEAGFARGINITKAFAQSAAQVLATVARAPGSSFAEAGAKAATSLLSALQKTYQQNQGQLIEALARGSISRAQFEAMGADAAKGFNTSLLNTISKLDARKTLTPEVRASLVNALKDAGVAGGEAFANGLTRIGEKLRSLGRDLTQFGIEASIVITAPLTLGAKKAVDAAETISHALDRIGVSTGAVGPQLEGLHASFETLFAQLPNSADDIGKAVAAIAVGAGVSGPALEKLATQALNLSRITGTDLPANVDATQRAFKAWGATVAEQAGNMDLLFRVSQRTGTTVASLAESLGHFAPALQQFGLTFAQSAALIGQFQKNGIDADAILTTLQTSLSKFAAKGIDGAHALQLLIDSLKSAGTDAEAINLASRIFGPRQAAQIAEAVRNGSLNIQQLTDTVRASATTINATAETTDVFTTKMDKLKHGVLDAAKSIGETLERAFIALSPALIGIVGVVASIAQAFATLPSFITSTLTVLLALAAAVGPVALAFAGLTKATGAVVLGLGILKNLVATTALRVIGTEATVAATGMTGAAAATGLLATGLRTLGSATLIGAAITAIVLIFEHFTKASREASTALDEFTKHAKELSNVEIKIGIDTIDTQIERDVAAIANLRRAYQDAQKSGKLTVPFVTQNHDQITALNDDIKQLSYKQAILAGQFAQNAQATDKATAATAAFNDAIAKVIETTGKGITVDQSGRIAGSLANLKKLATDLEAKLGSRIAIPGFDTTAATSALDHVRTKILELENANTAGIGTVFDQLSPSIEALDREVSALVAKAQNLGAPLAQLSDVKLSANLLTDLANVNRQLLALGDSTSLDAEKLRAMQKALQSTAAAQIGTNINNAGAFSIDLDGHIKSITVDPAAANGVIAAVAQGLAVVRAAAEQAAAQQLNLERVSATGSLQDIELAGIATEVAYRKARDAENAFRATVDGSKISIDQQKAAIAAMLDEVARTGASQEKISVAVGLSTEDVADLRAAMQSTIAKLPPVTFKLVPLIDVLDVQEAAAEAASASVKAQLEALAGHGTESGAQARAAADVFAKAQQALAEAALHGTAQEQAIAFDLLSKAAKKAGLSIEQVAQALEDMTPLGRALRLADAFQSATAAAFGTESAIALLTGSIDTAIKGAIDLKKSLAEVKLAQSGEGNLGSSIADVVASAGSLASGIIGAVGTIGKVIGSLFGKSQAEIEHDNILKANNAALAELARSLDRDAGTAGRLGDIIRATEKAQSNLDTNRANAGQPNNPFPTLPTPGGLVPANGMLPGFNDTIHAFGLTIAQVTAEAKALGITLFNSRGELDVDALKKLNQALEEEAKILTTIGHDLASQEKVLQVRAAIAGGTQTAQEKLNDQLNALATTLDRQGGTLGKSLQDAAAAGPVALRAALDHLVDQIEAGTLTLAQLGGLKDVNELLDALGATADGLNALADTAKDVSDSLLNVPQGFKKALAEFNAQLPQAPPSLTPPPLPPAPPPPPPPPPTDMTPTRPPDVGTVLLDFTKGLFDRLGPAFTTPLADAIAAPNDALERLTVSASDVADTLDRMFRTSPTPIPSGESSDGIISSKRFDARAMADAFAAATAAAPKALPVSNDVHLHGAVYVDARDKPAAELFDVVKKEAQKQARQKTGDSTRVLDALQQ